MEKVIIAQLSVQENKAEEFLALAQIMIRKSNSESGCLTYKLLKEVNNENEFVFYEKYKNSEAVESHNASAHFKSFISSIAPLLLKEPIIENF